MSVTIPEVVRELQTLPPERVAEVYDFVLFLKSRPQTAVDEADAWSEEDMRDAISAGFQYAQRSLTEAAEHDAR